MGRTHTRELTGQKFCRLLVIKESNERDAHGSLRWVCKCDCGNEKVASSINLVRGSTKSCGCMRRESSSANGKLFGLRSRRGTNNITGHYWASVKCNAKKRNLDFLISIEYAQSLLDLQKFKCAISKIDLICDINNTFELTGVRGANTASLDRIDSTKGYIEGNVQWVHKDINNMKQSLPEEIFIKYCRIIVEANPSQL